jgi:hypothetical protein
MATRRIPSRIFPKISTLPRQRTEASHYLDMYKLTVEKKRIQQELDNINQKQEQLQSRLVEIDQQLQGLSDGAESLRSRRANPILQPRATLTNPAPSPCPPVMFIYLPPAPLNLLQKITAP